MGPSRPAGMHTPGLQKNPPSVPEAERTSGLSSSGIPQRDEDKIPLFLLKLWSIIEDPSYSEVIRWDDTGYSFHILDPYSFCRNVLPQYFKHNNLNSLIRQLNMYGFRKMTPIERSGLAHAESDQDHLEFSHPYFVRDHPEMLVNIKRKSSSHRPSEVSSLSLPTKDITLILDEIRQLREKNRQMEHKMSQMAKENQSAWQELSRVRQHQMKQQQIVNKLVQFLVALVQGGGGPKRLGKRNLLAIDEIGGKRPRLLNSSNNLADVLDHLQREISEGNVNIPFARMNNHGPIIADVTDEPELVPANSSAGVSGTAFSGKNNNYFVPQSTSPNLAEGIVNQPATPLDQQAPLLEREPEYAVPSTNSFNPSLLTLSPSIDRQITAELAEYFTQQDQGIDNCRELLGAQWDLGLDDVDDLVDQTDQEKPLQQQPQLMLEGSDPMLALSAPATPDLLTPSVSPQNHLLE